MLAHGRGQPHTWRVVRDADCLLPAKQPGRVMLYEPILRHFLFPAYETVVARRGTAAYVREYAQSQWLSADELCRIQLEKLNRLLAHCWREVPFLRAYWSEHGLRERPLRQITELEAYPTITKQLITANYEGMTALSWRGNTLSKTTGGSTGVPFRFEYTMDSYARRTAVMWRGYDWAGAGLGVRTAYLWGSGPAKAGWPELKDRLYRRAFNRRLFDAFGLREDNIDRYIDEIGAYRPRALVGYVAPVALVARRMLQTGRRISGLRGLVTGAEALYDAERTDIEAAFGCKVFNTYGTREVMLIAAECSQHNGLHINSDHLVIETLDVTGALVMEASGDIAVTDLHNYGMPMVRYLNGDRGTLTPRQCICGRGLPLMESVDGRVLDMIRTPDGRQLLGEFFVYVMLEWPEVKQWQVVQTALDCVQFRLVVDEPWPIARGDLLRARVQAKSGPAMRVEVVEVDKIANAASGKRRLTVSLERAESALGHNAP